MLIELFFYTLHSYARHAIEILNNSLSTCDHIVPEIRPGQLDKPIWKSLNELPTLPTLIVPNPRITLIHTCFTFLSLDTKLSSIDETQNPYS